MHPSLSAMLHCGRQKTGYAIGHDSKGRPRLPCNLSQRDEGTGQKGGGKGGITDNAVDTPHGGADQAHDTQTQVKGGRVPTDNSLVKGGQKACKQQDLSYTDFPTPANT